MTAAFRHRGVGLIAADTAVFYGPEDNQHCLEVGGRLQRIGNGWVSYASKSHLWASYVVNVLVRRSVDATDREGCAATVQACYEAKADEVRRIFPTSEPEESFFAFLANDPGEQPFGVRPLEGVSDVGECLIAPPPPLGSDGTRSLRKRLVAEVQTADSAEDVLRAAARLFYGARQLGGRLSGEMDAALIVGGEPARWCGPVDEIADPIQETAA